jgi:hypothetical protein
VCDSEILRIEQLDEQALRHALSGNTLRAWPHAIGEILQKFHGFLAICEHQPELLLDQLLRQRLVQDTRSSVIELIELERYLYSLTCGGTRGSRDLPVTELAKLHERLDKLYRTSYFHGAVAVDKVRDQGLLIDGARYYLFAAAILQEILIALRAHRSPRQVRIGYEVEGSNLVGTAVLETDPPVELDDAAWNRLRLAAGLFHGTVDSTRTEGAVRLRWTFPTRR